MKGVMMSNFEVFSRRGTVRANDLWVTMQRHGTLSLNIAAFAALGEPEAVELLFDPQAHVIGLRAAVLSCPDAYRVRRQSSGSGFIVSGRAFTRHYKIPTDQARRYKASMNDGVLIVSQSDSGGPSCLIEKPDLSSNHPRQTLEVAL